jgi:UDP-N-acetylglucosamine 2-epimerase (non-hydrolysing)
VNKQKKIILVVIGTRPEAIKMSPLIHALKESDMLTACVCVTAQHRQMLDQVLDIFSIFPDHDLNIMRPNQSLTELSVNILNGVNIFLEKIKPSMVLVHGDTTTTLMSALASFYQHIPIAHIEAGLRTGDINAPWPEEMNRSVVARLASYHFAPTERARQHLMREGVNASAIWVTGNTVVDSLVWVQKKLNTDANVQITGIKTLVKSFSKVSRIILVTVHRRESFGQGIFNICNALIELAKEPNVEIVYPVHLNPNVSEPVLKMLGPQKNIHLIKPLDYFEFVYLMSVCHLIITDSGGIQEEAPTFGRPVLVTREVTERQEGVDAGIITMVGTDKDKIIAEAKKLLNNNQDYSRVASIPNPYGDGKSAKKIVKIIEGFFSA